MLPAPQLVQSDGLLTVGFSAAGGNSSEGELVSHTLLKHVSGSNRLIKKPDL